MAKSINRILAELIQPDGDVKFEHLDEAPQPLDSANIVSIANSSGLGIAYYDSLSQLPISGLTAGDQAFVEANQRLYVSNGSGWYNVSLINLSPRFDSDVNSTFTIVDSATPLIITNPASDSDNPDAIITYSGEASDSAQYLVNITNDSSVWTFTPLSADSVYSNVTAGNLTDSDGGDFTYTFKASDQINFVNLSFEATVETSSLVNQRYQAVPCVSADLKSILLPSEHSIV